MFLWKREGKGRRKGGGRIQEERTKGERVGNGYRERKGGEGEGGREGER